MFQPPSRAGGDGCGRRICLQGVIHLPKPVHVDDVVAAEGGIDEEFALPMPVGFLQAKQIFLSAADTFLDREGLRQNGESRNFKRKNLEAARLIGMGIIHGLPRLMPTAS